MRVILLASWYPDESKPLNGIFFKEQAEALSRAGIDVIVVNINISPIQYILKPSASKGLKISMENGVKVYRYKTYNYFPKMYGAYIKYYSFLLNKIIKKVQIDEGKVDLIHIHSAFDAGIAYSKVKDKAPYVITEHSSRYHRNVINKVEEKMLYKTFSEASKIIAVGKGLAEKISKYSSNKVIEVLPNMVTVKEKNINSDRMKERFRFFSLAFLNEYKGMDILIEAFKQNKEKFKNVELFIGGDGPEREKLQNLITEYNLENNIFLLGQLNREEVAYHMSNCDCFALASRVETFGIVFIEAMYYGKPVIGTRTGGPDTFINSKCGFVAEIDDINQIAKFMVSIYENYYKYDKEYIKEYCKNTFSEEVIVNKTKSIYKEIIGEVNVE